MNEEKLEAKYGEWWEYKGIYYQVLSPLEKPPNAPDHATQLWAEAPCLKYKIWDIAFLEANGVRIGWYRNGKFV